MTSPQAWSSRSMKPSLRLKDAIGSHSNSFAVEGDRIYKSHNACIHVPDEYVPQILNIDITGQKLYDEYVDERINEKFSILAPVRKESNKMYMLGNKKCFSESSGQGRGSEGNQRSVWEVDGSCPLQQRQLTTNEAVGTYEFMVTPRSLLCPKRRGLAMQWQLQTYSCTEQIGNTRTCRSKGTARRRSTRWLILILTISFGKLKWLTGWFFSRSWQRNLHLLWPWRTSVFALTLKWREFHIQNKTTYVANGGSSIYKTTPKKWRKMM